MINNEQPLPSSNALDLDDPDPVLDDDPDPDPDPPSSLILERRRMSAFDDSWIRPFEAGQQRMFKQEPSFFNEEDEDDPDEDQIVFELDPDEVDTEDTMASAMSASEDEVSLYSDALSRKASVASFVRPS